METYFGDCTKLVNILHQIPAREEQYEALVNKCNVSEELNSAQIFQTIESIFLLKGDRTQKLENLLSHMHHAQLINFDYKFGITTSDSMIQQNGKCIINLKLDLLDESNQRKSVYCELTLNQFYQFFHELKRAHSLMHAM